MYVTISKRFKTIDKQEKSNSSVQKLVLKLWIFPISIFQNYQKYSDFKIFCQT